MRSDADGDEADGDGASDGYQADGCDAAAAAVLPPPREQPFDPDEQLWHTGSFAAITDEPARRRKLATGLTVLGVSTLGLCGFAGVKVAALAGMTPPSPPRYVITEQAQGDGLREPEAPPAPLTVVPQTAPPAAATPTSRPRPAAKPRTHDGDSGDDKPSKAKHRRKKSDD